jgi:hypothetical protein
LNRESLYMNPSPHVVRCTLKHATSPSAAEAP